MRDRNGGFLRVAPYAGGTNYYCIDNGNINLVNYQANQIYFGINFKPGLNRPPTALLSGDPKQLDFGNYTHVPYIVAWGLADDSPVDQNVKKYYELIKKTEHLKIFKSLEQAENTNLQEEKNGKTGS